MRPGFAKWPRKAWADNSALLRKLYKGRWIFTYTISVSPALLPYDYRERGALVVASGTMAALTAVRFRELRAVTFFLPRPVL